MTASGKSLTTTPTRLWHNRQWWIQLPVYREDA
jgi:hypothetical protein